MAQNPNQNYTSNRYPHSTATFQQQPTINQAKAPQQTIPRQYSCKTKVYSTKESSSSPHVYASGSNTSSSKSSTHSKENIYEIGRTRPPKAQVQSSAFGRPTRMGAPQKRSCLNLANKTRCPLNSASKTSCRQLSSRCNIAAQCKRPTQSSCRMRQLQPQKQGNACPKLEVDQKQSSEMQWDPRTVHDMRLRQSVPRTEQPKVCRPQSIYTMGQPVTQANAVNQRNAATVYLKPECPRRIMIPSMCVQNNGRNAMPRHCAAQPILDSQGNVLAKEAYDRAMERGTPRKILPQYQYVTDEVMPSRNQVVPIRRGLNHHQTDITMNRSLSQGAQSAINEIQNGDFNDNSKIQNQQRIVDEINPDKAITHSSSPEKDENESTSIFQIVMNKLKSLFNYIISLIFSRKSTAPSNEKSLTCTQLNLYGLHNLFGKGELRLSDMSPSIAECAAAKKCGLVTFDKSDVCNQENAEIRQRQIDSLVIDTYCPGIIQEAVDGTENFNDKAFNLADIDLKAMPDRTPTEEPLTLLEAFNIRINIEREALSSKLSTDAPREQLTEAVQRFFNDKHNPTELNRSIGKYLLMEQITDQHLVEESKKADHPFKAEVHKYYTDVQKDPSGISDGSKKFVVYTGITKFMEPIDVANEIPLDNEYEKHSEYPKHITSNDEKQNPLDDANDKNPQYSKRTILQTQHEQSFEHKNEIHHHDAKDEEEEKERDEEEKNKRDDEEENGPQYSKRPILQNQHEQSFEHINEIHHHDAKDEEEEKERDEEEENKRDDEEENGPQYSKRPILQNQHEQSFEHINEIHHHDAKDEEEENKRDYKEESEKDEEEVNKGDEEEANAEDAMEKAPDEEK